MDLPELIATASWYIWWQRRLHVRGEVVQPPARTGPAIHALTLNFTRAAAKPSIGPMQNTWPVVLEAQQVLNVDASFREEDNSGSCGAIIRDRSFSFFSKKCRTKVRDEGFEFATSCEGGGALTTRLKWKAVIYVSWLKADAT